MGGCTPKLGSFGSTLLYVTVIVLVRLTVTTTLGSTEGPLMLPLKLNKMLVNRLELMGKLNQLK